MSHQNHRQITPTHVEENWSYIHLPNGDVLQYKHIVMGVFVQLDEAGEPIKLRDGSTSYGVVVSDNIVGVMPKDALVKRGN